MAKHIYTGSGSPSSTPAQVGHHYIDITNKVSYISVGTDSSADWKIVDTSAVVSDSITDGVTNIAPSQNAVFDALALKQDAGNYITALTGDVTATGPGSVAATVASVGGKTASAIGTSVDDTLNATNANLSNTIVKRDASGNFIAGTIQADLNGTANNVSGIVAIVNGGTGQSNATAALNNLLPSQSSQNGKVLQTDGSNASWVTPSGGTWGSITGTLSDQTDLQAAIDAKQDSITGNNSKLVYKDSSSDVISLDNFSINTLGGLDISNTFNPNTLGTGVILNNQNHNINPIANSPNDTVTINYSRVDIDQDSDGFSFGTSGSALNMQSYNVVHEGTSDIGGIGVINSNFSIGNGTDAIDFQGIAYAYGFGQINANVNLVGPIQGYGFQPTIDEDASMTSSSYINAFYDFSNVNCASRGYSSFAAGPNIDTILTGSSYQGVTITAQIDTIQSGAGWTGFNCTPTLGTFASSSYFQGVNINPTITSARSATGLNVSMDNVTAYAGVQASLVIQDLTITFNSAGSFNNNYTIEYTDTTTAGNELVSVSGTDITVAIESGVSTATQVKAALDAIPLSPFTVTISGTAGNPQVTDGPDNFTGGEDPGTVLAAYLDGDVQITGSLSFGGALSIGSLQAFSTSAIVDGTGNPTSIHSIISSLTLADNESRTLADYLGVNTACLIQLGANSTVTSSFLGLAALGLPAVVNMGSGATVDRISAAAFALSLDASAAGGTIDDLELCRSLCIPNGTTAVTRLYGFKMDLPFGNPGTTTWGLYVSPNVNNYMQGNLFVGGTAGSDHTVSNSSVGIELKSTTKAVLLPRMNTTERNALSAINGMIIYNNQTNQIEAYENGSWVDL